MRIQLFLFWSNICHWSSPTFPVPLSFRCHASLSLTFCPAVVAVSFFGLHNFPSDNPNEKRVSPDCCRLSVLLAIDISWLWQHQPQWQRQRQRPGITTIVRQQQQQEAIANFCKHKKAFFFIFSHIIIFLLSAGTGTGHSLSPTRTPTSTSRRSWSRSFFYVILFCFWYFLILCLLLWYVYIGFSTQYSMYSCLFVSCKQKLPPSNRQLSAGHCNSLCNICCLCSA